MHYMFGHSKHIILSAETRSSFSMVKDGLGTRLGDKCHYLNEILLIRLNFLKISLKAKIKALLDLVELIKLNLKI